MRCRLPTGPSSGTDTCSACRRARRPRCSACAWEPSSRDSPERWRAMSDEELGAALSTLELAWPATPDLAPTVMASTRATSRPRVVRLPLSRSKRIMLVAAATLLLLAGAALAARFVIDLGAVVLEV